MQLLALPVPVAVLALSLIFHECQSFSVMVPSSRSVCRKMIPGHDKTSPQTSPSPFSLITSLKEVKGGDVVEVSIVGQEGKKFKGFYLQGRDAKGNPIGTFDENTNAKTHSCGGIKSNAAHHGNPDEKEKVTVSWKAPAGYKGSVAFQATVVEKYTTYWTPVKAPLVEVS